MAIACYEDMNVNAKSRKWSDLGMVTQGYRQCHHSIECNCTTTTTPVQRRLFQDNLGKPVPEKQNQSGFK